MQRFKAFVLPLLLINTGFCLATETTSTISELKIVYVSGGAPYATITTTAPNGCSFAIMLPDLTDQAQKQMYATLVSAKINGLPVYLNYTQETSSFRCRLTIVGI